MNALWLLGFAIGSGFYGLLLIGLHLFFTRRKARAWRPAPSSAGACASMSSRGGSGHDEMRRTGLRERRAGRHGMFCVDHYFQLPKTYTGLLTRMKIECSRCEDADTQKHLGSSSPPTASNPPRKAPAVP
jgi:hypothetical protein